MSSEFYELHANLCSIFSSPRRLEIIDTLGDKELTVSEILHSMSISKTNLSQHLSLMKDRGIVHMRREGQHVYYSITNTKIIQAYKLMGEVLKELMDKKVAELKHNR